MGGDTEFLGWGGQPSMGGDKVFMGGGVRGHPGALLTTLQAEVTRKYNWKKVIVLGCMKGPTNPALG